jgi:hypothetical protein
VRTESTFQRIVAQSQSPPFASARLVGGDVKRAENRPNEEDENHHPRELWKKFIYTVCGYAEGYNRSDKDKEEKHSAFIRRWTKINAIASCGAVIVAIVAAGIFLRQWDVARDTEQRQLRAYLSPRKTVFFFFDRPNSISGDLSWRIAPTWENSGDTPATNVSIYTIYTIHDSFAAELPPYFTKVAPTNLPFAPHELERVSSKMLALGTIRRILLKTAEFKIHGLATYDDVFHKHHVTMFCRKVDLPYGTYDSASGGGVGDPIDTQCEDYNGSFEFRVGYAGRGMAGVKSSFPAIRKRTVRMVLKRV